MEGQRDFFDFFLKKSRKTYILQAPQVALAAVQVKNALHFSPHML